MHTYNFLWDLNIVIHPFLWNTSDRFDFWGGCVMAKTFVSDGYIIRCDRAVSYHVGTYHIGKSPIGWEPDWY